MPDTGSVSNWLRLLRDGRESAAGRLWARYRKPMGHVADTALGSSTRTVADEEDVVIRAFTAFLRRTAEGAYPTLQTRDDLWRVLVRVTRTYAWRQARFFGRHKRRATSPEMDPSTILTLLADPQPPPDVVAGLSDTLNQLLAGLPDDELRKIAVGRLEGRTNAEIATLLDRSVSTIERRVQLIRNCWLNASVSQDVRS